MVKDFLAVHVDDNDEERAERWTTAEEALLWLVASIAEHGKGRFAHIYQNQNENIAPEQWYTYYRFYDDWDEWSTSTHESKITFAELDGRGYRPFVNS